MVKAERISKEPKAAKLSDAEPPPPEPEVAPAAPVPPAPAGDAEMSGTPPLSEDAMVARVHDSIDEEFLQRHTAMTRRVVTRCLSTRAAMITHCPLLR